MYLVIIAVADARQSGWPGWVGGVVLVPVRKLGSGLGGAGRNNDCGRWEQVPSTCIPESRWILTLADIKKKKRLPYARNCRTSQSAFLCTRYGIWHDYGQKHRER